MRRWRDAYHWSAAVPAVLLVCAAAIAGGAAAQAQIGWEKAGAFETCLDAQVKAWLQTRVELVVNEDPAASQVDDTSVATWATEALRACAAKAGGAEAASEQRFMRYMARWRDHIFKAADEIRGKARPD